MFSSSSAAEIRPLCAGILHPMVVDATATRAQNHPAGPEGRWERGPCDVKSLRSRSVSSSAPLPPTTSFLDRRRPFQGPSRKCARSLSAARMGPRRHARATGRSKTRRRLRNGRSASAKIERARARSTLSRGNGRGERTGRPQLDDEPAARFCARYGIEQRSLRDGDPTVRRIEFPPVRENPLNEFRLLTERRTSCSTRWTSSPGWLRWCRRRGYI